MLGILFYGESASSITHDSPLSYILKFGGLYIFTSLLTGTSTPTINGRRIVGKSQERVSKFQILA